MARQLAAFPKKQFDMYRTKPRGLVSTELFTLPPPTLKEKLVPENTISNKAKDLDIKDIILDISQNTISADVGSVTPKSNKKKSKKKKKKSAASAVQTTSTCNEELQSTNYEQDKVSNLSIEDKLLDSDASCSRVATMNKTMVADISVSPFMESNTVSAKKIFNSSINDPPSDKHILVHEEPESKKCTDRKDINELHEINCEVNPPFGYPLSTEKLIKSAIELLSDCEPSKDQNTSIQKTKNIDISNDSSSVSVNSPIDIDISVDVSNSPPEPCKHELKNTSIHVDESVDGDVSNLSAWEEEGWQQSQGKRSHRKKKREFISRERSNSNQKKKSNYEEENKPNGFKRQNPRNVHHRKIGTKLNASPEAKSTSLQSEGKEGEKDKNGLEFENENCVDAQDSKDSKGLSNSEANSKAVFSYRDALLKVKPKNTEELQYNSDSGVDVNSIGSCDSAIHSPKMANEFDLEEAVNYLMKGWNEVTELKKQGKVVYFSENTNPVPANRNKKPFKKNWHPRPKYHE